VVHPHRARLVEVLIRINDCSHCGALPPTQAVPRPLNIRRTHAANRASLGASIIGGDYLGPRCAHWAGNANRARKIQEPRCSRCTPRPALAKHIPKGAARGGTPRRQRPSLLAPVLVGKCSLRFTATAASTANVGEANAAHTPSPVCLNNQPPCVSIAERNTSSWAASAARIRSASFSHRRVEPSTSVNRNVTTPEGAAP
jgi:hypothetical protein